ncbi:sirohydrochlorin chelatase [Acidovorax sp. sic0104]|uniref:sirohydrochlorin chelatase n=1 Tax=Acidovorax sp. sic0104 TaxID=2854784 RepID=UPI001C46D3BE|nr:CbiX/SirB N-terminal domain-containing protein [Acidovorax sp. sic0104]MBV7543822.1 CbiX/SirB N-terminal domain-containing protein [Acidovorax sp. sic0104]
MSLSAIILFSHGSRDPLWRAPMEAVATRIAAAHPERPVACAYLELCTPGLAEAAAQLVAQGATEVTVVPMFLGTGKHAREDLPVLVQALRGAHPATRFHVQQAIGEDPRMTALMADIACESRASR